MNSIIKPTSNKGSLLTRDNSQIIRGVAILCIMLHNYLHQNLLWFSKENEMSFSSENADSFFNAVIDGSNVFYEFFSHLGWIGVPVFVFLTGYGIALAPPLCGCKSIEYIKRNYLKLLALMLPAVFVFAGVDILKGNLWPDLLKRFSYLTMMANFAYPFVRCSPGVYWYFGLTFQFYLLWALMGKHFNWKNLLILSMLLLVCLYGFSAYGSSESLSIFRHCFTGWFPVFAIGVWLGISKRGVDVVPAKSIWMELLLFVALFALIILFGKWMVLWLFIPIIALGWFIVIGLMLLRTRYLSEIFRWIGKYSACIFVCHPIARLIVNNALLPRLHNMMAVVLIYVVLTIGIALVYDKLYKWLLGVFIPKTA